MVKTGNVVYIPIQKIFEGKAYQIIQQYKCIENLTKSYKSNAKVNSMLKDIFNLAKIQNIEKRKLSFHVSRHTCASLLSEQGYTRDIIKNILGHTKASTTDIYINNSKEELLLKAINQLGK